MKIRILPEAVEDLIGGYRFYQRQSGWAAEHFIQSLAADIESLRNYAGIHCTKWGYHRMPAKKFPYAIFYRVEGGEVRIRAVLDCRRDPDWIHNRLKG